jgi:hypothetical protein
MILANADVLSVFCAYSVHTIEFTPGSVLTGIWPIPEQTKAIAAESAIYKDVSEVESRPDLFLVRGPRYVDGLVIEKGTTAVDGSEGPASCAASPVDASPSVPCFSESSGQIPSFRSSTRI